MAIVTARRNAASLKRQRTSGVVVMANAVLERMQIAAADLRGSLIQLRFLSAYPL